MADQIIVCPICDEPSIRVGKAINMKRYIIYPRKCIMGHRFYSKEFVPDNYGAFQEYVEEMLDRREQKHEEWKAGRKDVYRERDRIKHNKRNREKRRERKAQEKEDRKLHPELYPIDRSPGKHYFVVKRAGEKAHHIIPDREWKKSMARSLREYHKQKKGEE